MAAAWQSHANATGNCNLSAFHPAPDRARRSRYSGLPRTAVDTNIAGNQGRHHENAGTLVQIRYRQARYPGDCDLSPGLPATQPATEAARLEGFFGTSKSTGAERLTAKGPPAHLPARPSR